ncbi:2,4-dienoyl-CoA reductase-like NADH-dependent reductase (Old Yellow Enzyme family) [Nitrospirillum amazonense]|uniref:2,4-dienoyl-CoA reductase-like NADH-dependent reductase (Old Yellow Enzyme family) n=1 Tax=Nitrospirillum amazonense TaxID=28077 RepID=A0A560F9S7_9PROT|nr:NADH:flavin oxidoreductase [Nitrospirillum amazonense]TWB18377.1 2,4-dienoyl-CoA reductase-like NADH-dependent reductase (Old Yellow Enzyme family) [Nitrospirillum amazonense]TWB66102.1 2,4-dienoyl-CoA reductase-like NADH-dependent reductase (Old Yellow Enzyme family) [Nitrospirillum amazonense]
MANAFASLKVGPLTLPNRFIRSGANEMMTKGCVPTQSLLQFHERLAAGGVGLTTLAYIAVSPDGRTFTDQGVMNAATVSHYRAITDAIHAQGGKASAQITHGGSFAQHKELTTRRAMSASGGLDKIGLMLGRPFQHAMTRGDMEQVRGEFVRAAQLAAEAGFDAVELHMGHGYLLNQFISPLSNKRRDAYGGSAAGRARFPAEVLAAVKAAVGHKLAVLAKINLYDGAKGGATVDDAIVTAQVLELAGVDMLVLSGGRNIESPWVIFSSPLPYDDFLAGKPSLATRLQFQLLKMATPKSLRFSELYFLEAARRVRAAVSCHLGYLGGVLSLSAADKVLREGFDTVVIARALIHDPELVRRFRENPAHRSGCTACNRCVAAMYGPSGTHCPLTDNAISAALNQVPAGASG